jgi:hypothetical protein
LEIDFESGILLFKDFEESAHRIKKLVHHSLFQWNDGIVCNLDAFGTHVGTALSNVAIPNAVIFAKVFEPVFGVERMHLERGSIYEKTGTDELIMERMFT